MASYSTTGASSLLASSSGRPTKLSTGDDLTLSLVSVTLEGAADEGSAILLRAGGEDYLKVDDAAGEVTIGNAVSNPGVTFAGTGDFTVDSTGTITLGGEGSAVTVPNNLVVAGNLTVNGTTTTVNSEIVEIEDNLILVNAGPTGTKNAGLLGQRFQAANNDGTGDVAGDADALVATFADIGAQTDMTATTITLNGGSDQNDRYVGLWIRIMDGVAEGDVRLITAYVGATRVATVATAWSVQPANGDPANIYSPFSGLVFDDALDRWTVSVSGSRTAGDHIFGRGDLGVSTLHAEGGVFSSGSALGSSNGAFTVHGGAGSGDLNLVSNSSAGEGLVIKGDMSGIFTSYNFIPSADSTHNIGSSDVAFATGYFDALTSPVANDRLALGTDGDGAGAGVVIHLPQFTTAHRDGDINASPGDFIYNATVGTAQLYHGGAWTDLGASTADSTTALTFTLNSDAVAGSDEDPQLILLGGDGTTDLVRTFLTQDSGGEFVSFRLQRNPEDGGFAEIAPNFQLGLNGGTANLDPVLQFNAGTGAAARTATITYDGSDGDLVFAATTAISASTNFDAEAGLDVTGAALTIGTGSSFSQTVGTFVYNVAASAFTVDAQSMSLDATAASNLTVTEANLTISTLTSGALAVSSAGTLTVTGDGASKFGDDVATLDFDGAGAVSETGMTSLSITPSGAITLTAGAASTWSTSSGSLSISSAADLRLPHVGEIISETGLLAVDGDGVVNGNIVAVNAAGRLARASAATHDHIVGVAASTVANAACDLAGLPGTIMLVSTTLGGAGIDAANGTVLYLSETAGALVKTVGDFDPGSHVIRVGVVVDQAADKILYSPQYMYQV